MNLPAPLADDPPTPPMRVLVVDDIDASRQDLEAQVRSMGFSCFAAASGREAIESALTHNPDLVLLDLLMPDMDGFEVTRVLRERIAQRWLPVVVTSSLAGDEHFVHALAQGADDYLVRPFTSQLLGAKLRHYQRVLGLQSRLALLAQRQHAIHEHLAEAIITVNGEGRVVESNSTARRWFGQDNESLNGRTLVEALGVGVGELAVTAERDFRVQGGQVLSMGVSFGSWMFHSEFYATITLHDLTERKRVERMKEEFLATVSHELRTPLTSIVGALGLLAVGAAGTLPGRAGELVTVARRNSERLSRLIDDVLDLTKLEGNQMPLHLRAMDLCDSVGEAVAANEGYAQRAGVRLVYRRPAEACIAQIDPDRFLQVMANLLSNAIKHSAREQTVTVSVEADSLGWRVDVADQGPGVPPEFRERLFDKFAQADSSDRRAVGGTGLGLYITRMLVERMSGTIALAPDSGTGSVFSVTFPAQRNGEPWILCMVRDRQHLDRLGSWLTSCAPIESVADLPAAQSVIARRGPASLVVADLQGLGAADATCEALRAFGSPIVLTGDSIDEAFAGRQRMDWVAPESGRLGLVEAVRRRLPALHGGSRHG